MNIFLFSSFLVVAFLFLHFFLFFIRSVVSFFDIVHLFNETNNINNTIDNILTSNYSKSNDNKHNPLIDIIPKNCMSIDQIIKIFNLNEKQIISFRLLCDKSININDEQRIILMSGSGGTGKTQVIKAIEAYFKKNNREDELILSASTGAAAYLINGKIIFINIF